MRISLLLLFLCLLMESRSDVSKTLKMVHLVYRHGARSPISFYPNDKYQVNDWPDGAGRLTMIGMNMEYKLGKFLKERYIVNQTFLNASYIHTQVYIRSSDEERCLQSAEVQLAGLYPPKGRQIWNKNLAWQPVPVHTVPGDDDPVLRSDDYCPKLKELEQEMIKKPVFLKKQEENKEFLARLSNYTGMDVSLSNLWMVTDPILCEEAQGLKLPTWVTDNWEAMWSLVSWAFLYKYKGDDQLGRLTGGTLLGMINTNMRNFSNGINVNNLFRFNIFSGHDTSILALTAALDIDIEVPYFASCIMLELYNTADRGYVVEIQYRNNEVLSPLMLKECEFSCPLKRFISLTKDRIPVNIAEECGRAEKLTIFSILSKEHTNIALIAVSLVCVLLFVAIITMFCRRRIAQNRISNYKQYHDIEKEIFSEQYLISDKEDEKDILTVNS